MHRTWTSLGAALAFIAVAGGAFGAHALRDRLEPDLLQVFDTGARYAMVHALALLFVGVAATQAGTGPQRRLILVAGVAFTMGTALFTGSLWCLALTGIRAFGAVTPLGGLCFLAGWSSLALAARRG